MAGKKRYIDVLSTKLTFTEDSAENPTFTDILRFMNGKEFRYKEKIFECALLDTTIVNCIVGLIVTTQDRNIPPIRNKRTKEYSKVNINPTTQGLAYANIFLYDIQRNILLYEVNKFGCFPNQLKEFVYAKWNAENENQRFELNFPAVLKVHAYQRMLNMSHYKKVIVQLYNPRELINCFDENSDSIENNILKQNLQLSNQNNADIFKFEQIAIAKKYNPTGLTRSLVKGLIDAVKLNILDKGFRQNIQTLKVEGYSEDTEDKGYKPIDLLADTFNDYFKIPDIQLQINVQQYERKQGIEGLYSKLLPQLKQLA
ncbi:MAG: hypothetical protein LBS54_06930 [Dysgonamonadaceae bacterium]|jgi:hypothetical protein|nr:hypothetical protein [Dysgonamonadaceae bacterium]